jgi:hypothetical protein
VGGLQHLAGLARVADDQDLWRRRRRARRRRAAQRQRQISGEKVSNRAAHAVGAEQAALLPEHTHGRRGS